VRKVAGGIRDKLSDAEKRESNYGRIIISNNYQCKLLTEKKSVYSEVSVYCRRTRSVR
jgi:shikimate kinase